MCFLKMVPRGDSIEGGPYLTLSNAGSAFFDRKESGISIAGDQRSTL